MGVEKRGGGVEKKQSQCQERARHLRRVENRVAMARAVFASPRLMDAMHRRPHSSSSMSWHGHEAHHTSEKNKNSDTSGSVAWANMAATLRRVTAAHRKKLGPFPRAVAVGVVGVSQRRRRQRAVPWYPQVVERHGDAVDAGQTHAIACAIPARGAHSLMHAGAHNARDRRTRSTVHDSFPIFPPSPGTQNSSGAMQPVAGTVCQQDKCKEGCTLVSSCIFTR